MGDTPPGDPCKGAQIFRQRCGQCHTATEGEEHLLGPNLHGLLERKSAGAAGYSYSIALQDKGISWNEELLFVFLENPKKFVPGTKMVFPGLKESTKRADLIAHLKDVTMKK